MSPASSDHYLEEEILSAAPQKLQLLLIEAAIQQGKKAQELWSKLEHVAARQAIFRAQQIVAQMLAGLGPNRGQPLVRRVAAVYSFIMQALAKANLKHDEQALVDALRILEIERGTWRQICEQLGNLKPAGVKAAPHFGHLPKSVSHGTADRLSLEA